MFTTFHGMSPREGIQKGASPGSRPKRNQVHRACDWCKLVRTKCDSHRPCHNCQHAGRECVTNSENQFRSVAAAAKEVERLRARVRDLESRVRHASPPSVACASLGHACLEKRPASQGGVRVKSVFYGVSSLPFFLKRMSGFLETALLIPHLDMVSQLCGSACTPESALGDKAGGEFLQRSQEDYFLDLFWQSHHFSYPIIDEAEFRKAYRSLWSGASPRTPRQASPLIDIVLALCIQSGTSYIPQPHGADAQASPEPVYSTLAGYQYYQRCQAFLENAMESPSITTVQCYIFSIVYLGEAGLLNRAQVITAEAIIKGIMLGLNNEPQGSKPEPQKEIYRRIWWSIYTLDAQLGIELGRPCMVIPSQSTCRLPSECPDIAQSLGPHYMFDDDDSGMTWLGFQTQNLRLLNTVRSISSAFYAKCDAVVSEINAKDFYGDGKARESCARFLTDQMKELSSWAKHLPAGYKMARRSGEPFSTDRSPAPLDLDYNMPICYQRQRLILELQYHLHALILYRPFICFAPTPETATPLSDSKAASSLSHAMALTYMLHQALTCSEILSGMNQVFRWQSNALFTMLGFSLTYPVSQHTVATRRAIETAITVVETYRFSVPEAAQVVATARNLVKHINAIVVGFRGSIGGKS